MTNEDIFARVGDYVLGLMSEADRLAMELDMQTDRALREAVQGFSARMATLDDTAGETHPSEQLWQRISRQLDTTPQEGTILNMGALTATRTHRATSWTRVAALAASLLVGLALGYLAGWISASREPVVVVILQTPNNETGAVFEAYADNSVKIVPLTNFEVPEGQVMQVWTLYDKAVGPVSLGTLTQTETTSLGSHSFPAPTAEQLYEITLEPSPGSPTGKPTGPILVKGFAKLPAK